VNQASYEQREVAMAEMVDKLKVAIVSMFNHFLPAVSVALTSRYCTRLLSSARK
jgi:hypothetical protein